MAEYIGCRNCESPDCKGCNLKNLETMMNNGKFDCLMNENRCINPSADVDPVRHGRWLKIEERMVLAYNTHFPMTITSETCSECNVRSGFLGRKCYVKDNSCPNCGAKMDLEG